MDVAKWTDPAAFDELREEWLHLLAQLPYQSVFLTPQYLAVWWKHFAKDRKLCLFTVRSKDGTLRGLAPMMMDDGAETGSCLSMVGDLEVSDYCDVLIDPAFASEVGQVLVSAMLAELGDGGEVKLFNLSSHSLTPGLFSQILKGQRPSVQMEKIETCPTIDLPTDWQAYLTTLRAKDRNKLRRNKRQAEDSAQLDFRTTREAAQLTDDMEVFISLHRKSEHKAKREFMTAEKADFFLDLAEALGPYGWFELALLYADGVAISSLCCFTYGSSYAVYNAGFHPAYSHLSPGIVLIADRIRNAIASNFTHFDFLRGNEAYKYRFGARDQPLFQLILRA